MGSAPSCVFICLKPISTRRGPASRQIVQRVRAHEGAAGVGGSAVASAAEHGVQTDLTQRLALDVPQRDVDGRQRQREDAAGTGARGGAPQLGDDGLDAHRVLADHQLGQRIDGRLAGPRQGAAEERDADALDAVIRPQLQGDKFTRLVAHGNPHHQGIVCWSP